MAEDDGDVGEHVAVVLGRLCVCGGRERKRGVCEKRKQKRGEKGRVRGWACASLTFPFVPHCTINTSDGSICSSISCVATGGVKRPVGSKSSIAFVNGSSKSMAAFSA